MVPNININMSSLTVDVAAKQPTFPNIGVSLSFLESVATSTIMETPMVQLLRPNTVREDLEDMELIKLRQLAKDLRVHSSLSGEEEFNLYEDETIPREDWISAVLSPPTTSTHINVCFVKPLTKALGGSYAEKVLKVEKPHWVGIPTDFVSHAWRYDFKSFVFALKEESVLRDQELVNMGEMPIGKNRFYWNDIFVEDQNATTSKPEGYFFHAFRNAIISISRTVVVASPLQNPIIFTRAWCIWEIYCTLQDENAELVVTFPPSERIEFKNMLRNNFNQLINVLTNVNVENSDAFVSEDREKIHEIVKTKCKGGFQGVNGVICKGIRCWLSKVGTNFVEEEEKRLRKDGDLFDGEEYVPSEATLVLMNQLGRMLHNQGEMKRAEFMLRRSLEGREKLLGSDHSDTLDTVTNLSNLLNALGKTEQVEKLLNHAIEVRRESLGEKHADTLTSLNALGTMYFQQGKLAKAEPLMKECYHGWKETVGEDDENTLTCASNLSFILQSMRKLDEAETLNRSVLQSSERMYGSDHPDTLISVNNLVLLLKERGKYNDALPLCERVKNGFVMIYGEDHLMTLNATGNFGLLLMCVEGTMSKGRNMVKNVLDSLKGDPHFLPASHPWISKFQEALN